MNEPEKVTTIVFDWGDTLMHTIPGYTGAMVDWPEIAVVDGTAQALQQLDGQYRLVVGTNASDSSAGQVMAALQRGGLGQYFQQVFTAHELGGLRKPHAGYFHALQAALGAPAHHMLMVGDDYQVDVLGAYQAGWRTLWYNPAVHPCPGLAPLQDNDIYQMSDLPSALSRLRFPGWDTCQAWMRARALPHTLLLHSHSVAAAAYLMAIWLRKKSEAVDPVLAHRGGLLHDLAKVPPPGAGHSTTNHGEAAARLLSTFGQPELAQMARRHMLFSPIDPQDSPQTWEEKLVYFADKLVEGSGVVTFEERLQALSRRYHMEDNLMEKIGPALETLQAEICHAMHLPPQDLVPTLRRYLFKGA
jgi:beta-phosphoglucomutase-like phosphatase (HAD superfamily)